MMIECDACTAGPAACADCVVTFLTVPVGVLSAETAGAGAAAGAAARPPTGRTVDLDAGEQRAIQVLATSGLVPPLRMQRTG